MVAGDGGEKTVPGRMGDPTKWFELAQKHWHRRDALIAPIVSLVSLFTAIIWALAAYLRSSARRQPSRRPVAHLEARLRHRRHHCYRPEVNCQSGQELSRARPGTANPAPSVRESSSC